MIRRRSIPPLVLAAIALLALAGAARAAFPQDPPNDYDADCGDYPFFSYIPGCTPNASDPENAAGMSIDKAWKAYTAGNGRTVIAYVEAGINWHNGDAPELANRVFLNRGELPAPTTPKDDGVLNARDYADTPDANANGIVDPEDIIKRFSDGIDDDHNGYADDISGWDFYDNQNDPATVDSAYGHSNGQMKRAAAQADNGQGGVGECPRCMILPVKAGAEALDRTDDLAEAWLYASDMRADVIVSVTADLGYSTFMEQAIEHIWRGNHTVMVEASNDFDSTDHQGGMFHAHVLPGNGMLKDKAGFPDPPQNQTTTTYRARSGLTSWGTHNVFTGETYGGSTSESTPTVGGVMALVIAYGKEAAREGKIARPLTADEAIQVVRATASDVNDPNSNWPSGPGFDLQFGYGRPNVFNAMRAVSKGRIPPVGWINSPRWYSLYDPTRTRSVAVRGHVAAPRSSRYRWRLEFAPGAEPVSGDFITAGRGNGSGGFSGRLGSIDLSKVPQSFWKHAYQLSTDKQLSTSEQYTVTIRLRVFDAAGRVGEDRRTIAVHHDPTLRRHFPKLIGPGGEAQPQLADLQGRGGMALVFGDSDGVVHAIDGRSGRELPGWPVKTNRTRVTKRHRGVDPGHEPVFANVAIGDLDHNGHLDVVASTSTGNVYVWDERGHRRPGWPKALRRGVAKPAIPRPDLAHTRLPVQGTSSPPVLYDLNGDRKLEIVQTAWDGHVYVWKPSGAPLAGWPKKVKLPQGFTPASGHFIVNDSKIDLPPAIGDLDGDGRPEVIVRSQDNEITGDGIQPDEVSHLYAYHANGSLVDGFPNSAHAILGYYGSAQEFVTEGTDAPTVADAIPGDGGAVEIANSPGIFSPTYLFEGDGSEAGVYGPVPSDTLGLLTGQTDITEVLGPNPPTDAQVTFTTSGAFGRFGSSDTLAFVQPGSGGASTAGALLLAGSGLPIHSSLRAYDAGTAADLPGFPSASQGLDFLGAAVIGDVSGDGKPDLIEGGDSSALHAFVEGGGQADSFPKFQTGWIVWGPSLGDVNGDGRNDLAAMTREGYLMVWRTPGRADANEEWWSYRHDERNTAQHGADTRPPGAIRRSSVVDGGHKLSLRAPGDDWYVGKAARYRLTFFRADGSVLSRKRVAATAAAGHAQTVGLPAGAARVRVIAVDDAGNLGRPLVRRVAPIVHA